MNAGSRLLNHKCCFRNSRLLNLNVIVDIDTSFLDDLSKRIRDVFGEKGFNPALLPVLDNVFKLVIHKLYVGFIAQVYFTREMMLFG
ncbi:hypothetical protein PMI07_001492 [Rhizobium sp. CF080]|nr:hypothetical protein PMI07_001492 [Rhizobium sp. CF080]